MSGYSDQDTAKIADATRSRVADALKETIEADLVTGPPIVMGHSKFEHVVSPVEETEEAQRRDEELMSSTWGPEEEARIEAFAEHLTRLRDAEPAS